MRSLTTYGGRVLMMAGVSVAFAVQPAEAAGQAQSPLLPFYKLCEKDYDVPWDWLAAVDRYSELTKSKSVRGEAPYYGFVFQHSAWAGLDNPDPADVNPVTIQIFRGIGYDANGDGIAAPWDERDRVTSLARWFDGMSGEEDMEAAAWALFQDPVAMDRITHFAQIFRAHGLYPNQHCFPIAKRYNYSVKHSFGAARSFGGRRSHEGVDIFASYGTPVLACSYGYVELKGWNRFGGWRVGIRDTDNVYYYYAHLSSFAKGLKQGQLVVPGQVIGFVGSTGYGPPGTAGKFPPHLHFGMYKDTGRYEWAYSPSSSLARWERLPQKVIWPNSKE